MNKKITTISITAIALGMFSQLIAIFSFTPHQWIIEALRIIREISPYLNLDFLSFNLFSNYNFDLKLDINFLDLSIYIVMFLGLMLYLKSKGKEIRLLRFAFAIILIVKARSIFGFFLSMLFNGNIFQQESYFIFLSFLFFVNSIFWLWASYSVLKLLSKNISLLKVVKKKDLSEDYVDSPKSQRFLHHILDLILSITIFSKFVMVFLEPLLVQIESSVGERTALYFIILISRLIYFVVFEFGFRATPAKLLTGSQIIVNSGKSLSLKTVILRSLSRHVPLEALSYLGEGNGWHDQWVNTRVVKEENPGMPVKKYLWVFLLLAVIGILSYLGFKWKENYDSYQWQKTEYDKNIEHIEKSLSQITSAYFFKIIETEDRFELRNDSYYLKVERISDSTVTFRYFTMEDYNPTTYEIEQYYENMTQNVPLVVISKEELKKSYTKDYKSFTKMEREGIMFIPETQKEYYISKAYHAYKPDIYLLTTGGYGGGSISIELGNMGWPAKLIDITNIEGDLDWLNELPQEIKTKESYLDQVMVLRANNFETGKPYKFTFIIADSLGREEKFLIEGINSERTMRKIDNGQ